MDKIVKNEKLILLDSFGLNSWKAVMMLKHCRPCIAEKWKWRRNGKLTVYSDDTARNIEKRKQKREQKYRVRKELDKILTGDLKFPKKMRKGK